MESPNEPPNASRTAIERALEGLGSPLRAPQAPARPWSPAGAPGEVLRPLQRQEASPINRVVKVSVLEGSTLKVDVVPADINSYMEFGRLPTKGQRQGAFTVSFWDLPGVQSIAATFGLTYEPDAAVQEMVRKWEHWRLRLEWAKNFAEVPEGYSIPGLDIKFRRFQARGTMFHVLAPKALLGDQMGMGKSIEVLGTIWTIKNETQAPLRTLIMSPASVVGDWQKKFAQFAHVTVPTATGPKEERFKVYREAGEFLALSYDVFLRDYAEIMKRFRCEMLVADECQRLVNRKNLATQRLFEYVDLIKPPRMIFMSGSPIMNQPADLWPVLRMINPQLAGPIKSFESRYLKMKPIYKRDKETGRPKPMTIEYGSGDKKRTYMPMRPAGYQNLDELRAKLAPYLIRRLKRDHLSELPEKVYETVEITLGKKERAAYDELQAKFAEFVAGIDDAAELAEGAVTNFLQFFTRAQQICGSLEILGLGEESSKLAEFKEYVADNVEENKIIVFSRFAKMTDIVVRDFSEHKPLYLHGGIPQKDRQGLVDLFQEKEEHRMFVATLGAGGVGLTLTAAHLVARLDRWMAPALNDQAVDRAHRIGQERGVVVTDFVVVDSIEERIIQIVEKKKKLIGELMTDEQIVRRLRKKDLLPLL